MWIRKGPSHVFGEGGFLTCIRHVIHSRRQIGRFSVPNREND